MPITLHAPAKINLHLRVFPRGADGFHPLRSWFRTIELCDALKATTHDGRPVAARAALNPNFSLECRGTSVPSDEPNLVTKAWQTMSLVLGDEPQPARIELEKRIPPGAGLGGGSSDAAAALLAYQWARERLGLGRATGDELESAAEQIGADVPFFLRHQLDGVTDAACTGRGEIVQPFAPGRRHAVLLILPDAHVSTAQVYRRFDELPAPREDGTPDFAAWSQLAAPQLLPLLRNDLEAAAFSLFPEVAILRESAELRLRRPVRMTGSGSALFSLYDAREEAEAALPRLSELSVRALIA